MKHRNNFDLIRLFAAGQVMLSHSIEWLHLQAYFPVWAMRLIGLFPGVAIFFVISGYLITGSFAHSDKSVVHYASNRALRIYPGLWVNLTVILIALVAVGQVSVPPVSLAFFQWIGVAYPLASDYFANEIAFPLFSSGDFFRFFPSGVLWTLPIEICFYILVPIIFSMRRSGPKINLFSTLAWTALSVYIFTISDRSGYPDQIMHYLWIFLIGALLNLTWEAGARRLLQGNGWLLLPFFLIVGIGTAHIFSLGFNYHHFSIRSMCLTVLLGLTTISCAYTFPNLSERLLRGNDISYGIYLWHMPVVCTFMGLGLTGDVRYAFAVWSITIVIAIASWKAIERPALRLKGKLGRGNAQRKNMKMNPLGL